MKNNIQSWDKKKINKYGKNRLRKELTSHVKKTWCDPGHMADDWVDKSDTLITYRSESGVIVGFATGVFIDKTTLNLNATILDKSFQNRGIANRLNLCVVYQFIKRNPLSLVKGFYLIMRTPNPTLYESLVRKVGFYPDYQKPKLPSKKQIGALKKLASFSPGIIYDEEVFIARNILKKYPGFIYGIKDIPWSKNKCANDFFEERVDLRGRSGNMIVMVSHINIISLFAHLFRILL